MQQSSSCNKKLPHNGITEIILPHQHSEGFNFDSTEIIMPMLAHLSHNPQNRWLTWIRSKKDFNFRIDKSTLNDFGFDLNKLRIVYCQDNQDSLRIMRKALANGNSDTVVASPEIVRHNDLLSLEKAAALGATRGVLLCYR